MKNETKVSPGHTDGQRFTDSSEDLHSHESATVTFSLCAICFTFKFLDDSLQLARLGPCASLDQRGVGTWISSATETVWTCDPGGSISCGRL